MSTDRYDGNGDPVDHRHIEVLNRRLDILFFSNGKIAVWSPESSSVLSYHNDEYDAETEAMRLLNE